MPLLLIILLGTPYFANTLSTNRSTILGASIVSIYEIYRVIFEYLSITLRIESYTLPLYFDGGRPTIKSIAISYYSLSSYSSDTSNP